MGIIRNALLWTSRQQWLGEQFRRRAFSRRAVARFMPGEDTDSAFAAAEALQRNGIATFLTYLGENVDELAEADDVVRRYIDIIDRGHARGLDSQPSVKLTQLGLDVSRDATYANLDSIVKRAAAIGSFVWLDMEGSAYTDVTLEIFRQARQHHENIGICLQTYLHRTEEDLESLLPLKPAIRLVKGAYKEPPDVAIPRKKDVDANFLKLAARLIQTATRDGGCLPGIATHDTQLIARIQEVAKSKGLSRDACEIQMLYGIGRDDQLRLVKAGNAVRVLISYGSAWFPWYVRRLAERPANFFFVLRSIFG